MRRGRREGRGRDEGGNQRQSPGGERERWKKKGEREARRRARRREPGQEPGKEPGQDGPRAAPSSPRRVRSPGATRPCIPKNSHVIPVPCCKPRWFSEFTGKQSHGSKPSLKTSSLLLQTAARSQKHLSLQQDFSECISSETPEGHTRKCEIQIRESPITCHCILFWKYLFFPAEEFVCSPLLSPQKHRSYKSVREAV